jgi:hypothetical protein
MAIPQENKDCYISSVQREVLLQLIAEPTIETQFFLTGGTALAVFYLYHRYSNDLDLFTCQQINLADLAFWITRRWPKESVIIQQSPNFLSCLIREMKVDLVIDPLSLEETRPAVVFENHHCFPIDTVRSIASNKLCACVSRTEPKDYIDLYLLVQKFSDITWETIYELAKAKEALFDDPPTAAFQIEEGLAFIKENPETLPRLRFSLDQNNFFHFYEVLARWFYDKLNM